MSSSFAVFHISDNYSIFNSKLIYWLLFSYRIMNTTVDWNDYAVFYWIKTATASWKFTGKRKGLLYQTACVILVTIIVKAIESSMVGTA